ncbi:MAG: hypothetical protein JWM16_4493 [Verrucomicrobiales bacterium]|nr:hypothetical protein [Verrucomicrobiales bacterium]
METFWDFSVWPLVSFANSLFESNNVAAFTTVTRSITPSHMVRSVTVDVNRAQPVTSSKPIMGGNSRFISGSFTDTPHFERAILKRRCVTVDANGELQRRFVLRGDNLCESCLLRVSS